MSHLCSNFLLVLFFAHTRKNRQKRRPQREQLATIIWCRSSDSFLVHKQCRSGLRGLWRVFKETGKQAEPSSPSACDLINAQICSCSTRKQSCSFTLKMVIPRNVPVCVCEREWERGTDYPSNSRYSVLNFETMWEDLFEVSWKVYHMVKSELRILF